MISNGKRVTRKWRHYVATLVSRRTLGGRRSLSAWPRIGWACTRLRWNQTFLRASVVPSDVWRSLRSMTIIATVKRMDPTSPGRKLVPLSPFLRDANRLLPPPPASRFCHPLLRVDSFADFNCQVPSPFSPATPRTTPISTTTAHTCRRSLYNGRRTLASTTAFATAAMEVTNGAILPLRRRRRRWPLWRNWRRRNDEFLARILAFRS